MENAQEITKAIEFMKTVVQAMLEGEGHAKRTNGAAVKSTLRHLNKKAIYETINIELEGPR